MEARLNHALGISFLKGCGGERIGEEAQALVQCEDELAVDDVIGNHVGREYRHVGTVVDLPQENCGEPQFERTTQLGVVTLGGPCSVVVVEQPTINITVVIRSGRGTVRSARAAITN